MRILILGLNYEPEPVGIGPYTAELARWLVGHGHTVDVVAAKPYYPSWRHMPGYWGLYRVAREGGVRVVRCPLYVPAHATGARRILHHASFLLSALLPMLLLALRFRPGLVMTIAPSLATVSLAKWLARLVGARSWLHVQDFEVEAALATGLMSERGGVARTALSIERSFMAGFDRYSSISRKMCERLAAKIGPGTRVHELRNWSDVDAVVPLDRPSRYRSAWDIMAPHVALYSGNIANKQGVEIIVAAARRLCERTDLTFVICGEGPTLKALRDSAVDLPNVRFMPLQPREEIGELLGLATVHLLPQKGSAADLVLPSKLTNMLASGRPVVATAAPDTGLAAEVEGCGAVTPPGDEAAFADAIIGLIDDPVLWANSGEAARERAKQRWSKQAILSGFTREVELLAG